LSEIDHLEIRGSTSDKWGGVGLYPSIAKRRYEAHPIARIAGVVVARGKNTADNTLQRRPCL